jgi:probable HAF family extracellular repeat protein
METATFGYGLIRLLIDSSLKGTLLLGLTGIAAWLLAQRRPAWTSLIWMASFSALMTIPLISLSSLEIRVPLLSVSKGALFIEELFTPQIQSPSSASESASTGELNGLPLPISPEKLPSDPEVAPMLHTSGGGQWILLLTAIYLAGLSWGILRLGRGMWGISTLRRGARIVDDVGRLDYWRQQLNIGQTVQLGISDAVKVPTAIGIWKPLVLIPQTLYAEGNRQHFDNIIIHELAHIKRRDSLIHLLGSLAVALYWFHPLVHLAQRSLIAAREFACDDWVVKTIDAPVAYASTLMEATARMKPGIAAALGIGMAQLNNVAGRIERVLHSRPKESPDINPWTAALVALCIAILGAGMGALHPTYAEQADLLPSYPLQTVTTGAREYEIIWMPRDVSPRQSPHEINGSGQVAVNTAAGERKSKAGLWSISSRDSVLDLGALAADKPWSVASSINDHGVVIGTVIKDKNHYAQPFLWTTAKGMQPLPTLGGIQTMPMDINNQNQVVGRSDLTGRHRGHAFLWEEGSGIIDLDLSPESHSMALGINDSGVVVGSTSGEYDPTTPFIWRRETGWVLMELPTDFEERGGAARDINNRGEVLVNLFGRKPVKGKQDAFYVLGNPFIWTAEEGYVALPSLEGYEDVRAREINNRGEVLLMACNTPEEPDSRKAKDCVEYLVIDNEIVELPQLNGADRTRYSSISDEGWIVGSAVDFDHSFWSDDITGETARGFVAKPLPANH